MGVRTKIEIGVAVLLAAILLFCAGQQRHIKQLAAERDRYAGNAAALLSDVEHYKVRDSLNAARVQAIELTLAEYKRFRANDAALIQSLKERNRDLAAVNNTQSQTIIDLKAIPRDTVVMVRDSIITPAVAVHCGDAWYDFDGIITQDSFSGTLANRDSLLIAETVKYKRFLGFLWKTRKVKDRQMDAVSLNPHTQIMNISYSVIEK